MLNSLTLQTFLYLAFVFIFQQLANTLRLKEEYYMDKHVMDRFVENLERFLRGEALEYRVDPDERY